MATQAMTVVWIDATGGVTLRTIKSSDSAAAIVAQLQALSNAGVQQTWEGQLMTPGTAPGTGNYISATQVAYLRYKDAAGRIARLALPAPHAGIFMADGVSVDPTAITALTAACLLHLVTESGSPVVAFDSGVLGHAEVNS